VVAEVAGRVVRSLRTSYRALRASRDRDAPSTISADPFAPDGGSTEPSAERNVPSDEFHSILHTLRTAELRTVPKGARRVVSVGASGRWYFDWFEDCVGPLDRHVGVEAFEPMPSDLPANVEWVPSTADDLRSIADASVDLVFAGQTTEHLWPDELVGFLSEAARVLRPDGLLVVDSPNRLVTQALHWSHGGHTIELSASEMAELLDLAGFRVETCTGLWRCRYGDEVRGLEEGVQSRAEVAERSISGVRSPDESFVWWINARRHETAAADSRQLAQRARHFFDEHWDDRVCRGMTVWPQREVSVAAGEKVELVSLPFLLGPRKWDIELDIEPNQRSLDSLVVEITAPGVVLHHLDADSCEAVSESTVRWRVDQPWLSFATSIVVRASASVPATIQLPVRLRPVDGW
jgi:SAM-dependent methyltransferase